MSRYRLPTKPAILLAVAIAATGGYWALLLSGIRLHTLIPGYFWHFMYISDKSLPAVWLTVPLALISAAVVTIVLRASDGGKYLPLLVLLGFCIQMGFGLMEARGIDGIRDRTVTTGHAEFAAIAAHNDDIGRTATQYEAILREADSAAFRYVRTKPPGQVIVYMLTQKLSNLINPVSTPKDRFDRLATFAGYLFPLMAYLVLIPLFVFARSVAGDKDALRACLLYTFIPAVTLVTMHLDQVLYPALAMTCLMLAALACTRRWLPYALLTGVAVYVSMFVSFSLLPVIPLTFLIIPVICLYRDDRPGGLKRCGNIVGAIILGMLTMYGAGAWLLNYDPFVRFENAMRYHEQWKAWSAGTGGMIRFALLNLTEFACWMGIALAVVYGSHVVSSLRDGVRKRLSRIEMLSLTFAAVIVLTAVFGRTKGEVGRLWIFFMPPVCLFAARELSRRFDRRSKRVFGLILGLQFVTILIMKKYMDFW